MILHYIPKDNLRQHWEYIRHGLEIVRSYIVIAMSNVLCCLWE